MAKTTARRHNTGHVDLRNGDCLALLRTVPDNSVDFIVTDPPYFLDQLGDDWDDKRINSKIGKAGAI